MSVTSPSPVVVLPAILGEVVVWGDDTNHQITERPKVAGFSRVAPGGATQGLVLGAGGVPVLWGAFGQGGDPTKPIVPPFTLTAGEKYVDIAIGVSFAAAIRRSDAWIETSGRFANAPHDDAAGPLKKFKGTGSRLTDLDRDRLTPFLELLGQDGLSADPWYWVWVSEFAFQTFKRVGCLLQGWRTSHRIAKRTDFFGEHVLIAG